MEKIAVIGSGLMGHGIGQIFAVHGHSVSLMDLDEHVLEQALENIKKNLDLMAKHGIGSQEAIPEILARVQTTSEIKTAVEGADFVFEAIVENLSIKQDVFQVMDRLCPPSTVLASNTSVISITEIASTSANRQRIVGTHFWNPPYLIPLVEVIPGDETAPETVDRSYALLNQVGKHAVKVKKDVPGFVGNRLQHALWREAISIVENGIADPATVDECVKYGFGLRLPILGPIENVDMVGTDLVFAIHDYILKHIEDSPEPSPMLKQFVEQGDMGFKSGRGFQTWNAEQIEQSRRRLQEYLLRVVKD